MFTGLIQQVGIVETLKHASGGALLALRTSPALPDVALGESISTAGVCLTVTSFSGPVLTMDVSSETLARTTLKSAAPGRRVNLERALRACDRIGGHFVSGHVDGIGRCTAVRTAGAFREMEFEVPAECARYVAHKGSVSVDGVSLTVAGVSGVRFTVAVIPATLQGTTLSDARPGTEVNIETDILARYVERLLADRGPSREGSLLSLLQEKGFGA
jgi:riboflavin synthase